jgi:hypothetical protein
MSVKRNCLISTKRRANWLSEVTASECYVCETWLFQQGNCVQSGSKQPSQVRYGRWKEVVTSKWIGSTKERNNFHKPIGKTKICVEMKNRECCKNSPRHGGPWRGASNELAMNWRLIKAKKMQSKETKSDKQRNELAPDWNEEAQGKTLGKKWQSEGHKHGKQRIELNYKNVQRKQALNWSKLAMTVNEKPQVEWSRADARVRNGGQK